MILEVGASTIHYKVISWSDLREVCIGANIVLLKLNILVLPFLKGKVGTVVSISTDRSSFGIDFEDSYGTRHCHSLWFTDGYFGLIVPEKIVDDWVEFFV